MGDRDLYHLLPASAQVLTNTDLLHGIFTFLPRSSPLRHSYLLGCTTVCRTFHAPAIRVLWRTLETLVTLWHLLAPSNVAYPFGYTYSGGRDKILLDYLHEVSTFSHSTVSRSRYYRSIPRGYTSIQYDGTAFSGMPPTSVTCFISRPRQLYAMQLVSLSRASLCRTAGILSSPSCATYGGGPEFQYEMVPSSLCLLRLFVMRISVSQGPMSRHSLCYFGDFTRQPRSWRCSAFTWDPSSTRWVCPLSRS